MKKQKRMKVNKTIVSPACQHREWRYGNCENGGDGVRFTNLSHSNGRGSWFVWKKIRVLLQMGNPRRSHGVKSKEERTASIWNQIVGENEI